MGAGTKRIRGSSGGGLRGSHKGQIAGSLAIAVLAWGAGLGLAAVLADSFVSSSPQSPSAPLACGDGQCNDLETPLTCPADCQTIIPVCGNGVCDPLESAVLCPQDCGGGGGSGGEGGPEPTSVPPTATPVPTAVPPTPRPTIAPLPTATSAPTTAPTQPPMPDTVSDANAPPSSPSDPANEQSCQVTESGAADQPDTVWIVCDQLADPLCLPVDSDILISEASLGSTQLVACDPQGNCALLTASYIDGDLVCFSAEGTLPDCSDGCTLTADQPRGLTGWLKSLPLEVGAGGAFVLALLAFSGAGGFRMVRLIFRPDERRQEEE